MLARVVDEDALEPAEAAGIERHRLLVEWNDTGEAPGEPALLHALFEARVDEDPEAVALIDGRDRLSRRELERRANRLAWHLRSLGVGPEVRVAICAERGAEMIVALFAVLKAGGAYVPVDPMYPRERQAIILEDSQASLLLTQERLLGRIPETSAAVFCLDRDWPEVERRSSERPGPGHREQATGSAAGAHAKEPRKGAPGRDTTPGNLAYLIYTSGSTGRPKGVAIEHRSAVSLVRWASGIFPPEELACVLASTSIGFDLSVFEIFLPLALGGRIAVAENALALPKLPAAGEVTLVNTVPSAISELARTGGIPPSVRVINLAGEPLRGALVERLYRIPTVEKVYNLYGPSEDTTYSTWVLMRREDRLAPSIGRPLDGTRLYLLDPEMEHVPFGEAGELYLAGAGLARGYLGRPELTAERFVPDPFAELPGERLYATGDLARYRPTGEIEFLGRLDHQVKIRGFRIELGEIEAALERHAAVADTVVMARESEGGEVAEKMLVAYVVAAPGSSLSPAELRGWLQRSLAEHMIPSCFVLLPALPLTPNGKVDRKALPAPQRAATEATAGEGYVAPRNPTEETLAGIWAEVLDLPRVGVDDDFFALGGHSIVATRILARVHEVFGSDLPARTLFDAPTVARLAARLAAPDAATSGSGAELPGLVPVSREAPLAASPAQEAMWLSDRLHRDLPVFNIPLALTLRGPLDAGALRRALSEIVRRHEALRVRFADRDGFPQPVLSAETEVGLPGIDLRLVPDPAGAAEALTSAAAGERIDLGEGPLLRALLLCVGDREHRLVLVLHHIVGDDWSTWILTRELAQLYTAFAAGRPSPLPGLPVQYSDYAAWHRAWLQSPEAEAQLRFWQERLAGAPEVLDLPTDRARPAVQSLEGDRLSAGVPAAAVRSLADLARRQGATLFMALLAAFETLLHRYTGRQDLVVGSPIAGRRLPQAQDLIGLFTNNLAWRADLSGDPTFLELLGRVREAVLEGVDRQELPFDRLVRELQPARSLSHSPIAQVAVALQNTPPLPRELAPGIGLELSEPGNGTSKLDLVVYLRETGEGLTGDWEHATALFDRATISRLAGCFRTLVAAAASHPETRLSDLPLLGEAERHQVLAEWNDTVLPLQLGLGAHELFALRAAEAPDAAAVVAGGRTLTRGELVGEARRLARRLRRLGVGPEVRVAVAAGRSPDMVVALLAVLDAGGAYVPLDPTYPAERLAYMLEDSGARVLLAQGHLVPRLPEFDGPVVSIEVARQDEEPGYGEPPALRATPDNLAYVIYTSGSTGKPKGVLGFHRGLVNLAEAQIRLFAMGPGSRLLQFSSFSFDAAVSEIFTTLLSGAELHVAPRDELIPGPDLARTVRERGITVVTLAPSALAALEAADPDRLPSARTLVVAGEACAARLAARWSAGRRFVNAYGPTEATVCATAEVVAQPEAVLPIGRPIANVRVYVLGPGGAPAPAGVPGEIAVGGAGVARGYLGRPELTAGKFVPDPVAAEPGARVYLTGDLGRLLPDGRIDFLGRRDDQVKIRGFRIELGEIEAALARQSGVLEAAVVVREEAAAAGAPSARRLLACVVPGTEGSSRDDLAAELRRRLAAELPDYMVPSAWVLLPAMPLTPNGKVDRRALARMKPDASAAEDLVLPSRPIEETLAGIWAEVLGIERVGASDRFFDLGGHSLLATQVLSRVRQAFGIELPMPAFFAAPALADLARKVERALLDGRGVVAAPPIERGLSGEVLLPLSFAQSRLWLLDRLERGSPLYNIPQALALHGPVRAAVLQAALGEIVRRHEVLRTRFESIEGRPHQVVLPAPPFRMTVVDLMDLPEEARAAEAARLAFEETLQPFDLSRPPMLRARLLRLGGEEHRLLLTLHHIASDGWSQGILARELSTLYAAFAEGRPSPLPELPIQYADFARWQQRWLSGSVLAEHLAAWRRRLEGAPTVIELPADRPRPAARGGRGAALSLGYPRELSQGARRLARRQGGTPFMVLLTAFEALLHRYTGVGSLLVGTPIAGRNQTEMEGLIGFFVNTLVLRADFDGDPAFGELLARARAVTLEAYAHQDLPFEKLVEELRPERDLAHTPLFQVMLAVQNVALTLPSLPGLRVEEVPVEHGTAKFDLTLFLIDHDEGIGASFEYATELFDGATIARWAGHYRNLLAGAVAAPEAPLSTLPLLDGAERVQLLVEWNDTGDGPAGGPLCLHRLFEAQAARTPDAEALVHPRERLTYRELDRRAERLAAHLRRLGVGAEVLCGVLMDRTPELVVGLLAVLKAGGAYVPLDPNYPASRVRLMLEISRAAVLLTRRELLAALGGEEPAAGATPVFLGVGEEGWEEDLPTGEAGPALPPVPGNLAYLIFTSGSTGLPKGVALEHRNAVAFVLWAWEVFPAEDLAGVLAATSICFDLSVFELFVPLSRGGRVILADNALHLPDLPAPGEVTLINTVPSALAELVLDASVPPSVRTVNLAGEPLKNALAQEIYGRTAIRRLLNLYGPSEDTTYSTFAPVRRGSERAPSIGRPVAGTRAYVLDAALRPVPLGIPGALYLAGAGLARGYYGRPELTADRFVPDPFAARPGERLYKTGDLVRYRPDGELDFLGRIDHQVKVRGFRIELGEVEGALAAHPQVREAAVLALSEGAGAEERLRLVAFLAAAGEPPASSALRDFLRRRLPEYMVPTAFVVLAELPLTPNGKLDRKALSRLGAEAGARPEKGGFVPPRTPAEEAVAEIWAGVFGVERVGACDNFFDLGGHSLLAVQVLARVRARLGADLPLRRLFEAQTVERLAEAVEEALGDETPGSPDLGPQDDGAGGVPLSFAQRRLWFLDRMTPGLAVYNLPYPVRIEGELAPAVLEAALGEVVRRHGSLRTTIGAVAGKPVQVIASACRISLPGVDLTPLPEAARRAELDRLVREESRRPFDLEAGPLLRSLLVRAAELDHALLLTLHHIVSDGWSMEVLLAELAEIYEAFALDRPSPLPEPTVQYADFARWQRRYLQGDRLEAQLGFWRERLAGAPSALELPTDRPRPAVQSFRGSHRQAALSPRLSAALRELARGESATLFMLCLAALDVLLFRYTGQEDLLVGTPVANRSRPELDGLIGFFANTLVLRADLSGNPAFRELLAAVRENALAAYAHQDLPFDTLVEALRPERDPSRPPLFQVALTVEGAPRREPRPAGLRFHPLPVDTGTAKFDLTLQVTDTGSAFVLSLEYASDLFEAATVDRMLGHLARLLEGIAADPAGRLLDLPLLSAAERHQAVVEWNDSRSELPREALVHELVARWAERTPGAVAVEQGGRSLTYGELGAKVRLLAEHLRALGVGPDVAVALMMERSPDLIVAILAILEAGGAYAPLDPAHPRERLAFVLEDTGAPLLLAHGRLLDRWPGRLPVGTRPLLLDEGWEAAVLSAPSVPIARPSAAPDSLAYIMYTSGTTGRPKGVAVPHRAVVRLVRETGYARLDACETILQLGPIAFDASTFEIWGALANGGRLVLFPGERPSLGELGEVLERHRISTLWLTAGLFHQMAERDPGAFRGVRQLLTGGEVVSPQHVRTVLEAVPGCTVTDGYGPTENTTFTCCFPVRRAEEVRVPLPLGRPIANSRAFLLDRALRPVPVGVPGQLYAGGDGLARGYLGRPDLTAERFVPDPLGPEPGGRLYATGDLARWLPDGRLDFLGRIDQQVKVRGFRIELPEIESVLASHPAVAEAVVLLRVLSQEDKRLVAYVVTREGAERPAAADLRALAQERLPEPMVPSAWVFLDALPLTPNGKVDRRALARVAPDPSGAARAGAFVAPRTPAEAAVARIWAEVLKVPDVGVHDNFFELGGHSLLATQIVSRLGDAFGIELPLRRLWETPTVAGLAAGLDVEVAAGVDRLPPIVPVARRERMPLSFAQRRLWFLEHLTPGLPLYNIPAPVRIAGDLDANALERSLSEVICRHEALRTTFGAEEGEPYQVIALPAPVRLPRVDLSGLNPVDRAAELERRIREEAVRPFDLAKGPLLRAVLLRLRPSGEEEPAEHALLLALHHIVSDGWSMEILLRELAEVYDAFAAGRPSPLPELPVQYADFASWQLEVGSRALAAQRAWWRERLAGAPAALDLPTDRPRPAVQTSNGASREIPLPPPLSRAIRDACQREGVTLFMWMLAAFDALLARHTGEEDLLVGSPIANRNRREIEGLIGFFVNTLVLRADTSGDPAFRDLLGQAREMALGAYAHQDLPFESLVEELRPERDLSRSPLFQVMLSVHAARLRPPCAPGIRLDLLPVASDVSKFDLSLNVEEGEPAFWIGIEYNTDLFDAATAGRLLERFALLLEAAVEDPGLRLSQLPQLTEAERHQALVEQGDAGGVVLDRWGRQAPPGVAGELCTERPDGVRRSGRRARRLPDGRLELLGRVDQQVRVRGCRIDLGEVETALCAHPAVRQAAVLALPEPGTGGGQPLRIVAFVAPAGALPPVDELLAFLAGRLPAPMIPAAFVELAHLPLGPDERPDPAALARRYEETWAPPAGEAFAAPASPAERALARVWQEVFQVDRVGLHDNFFDLGGHSLLAMRVVARIRSALGVELPVQRLFETPTLGSLAARVEGEMAARRAPLPPIVPVPRDDREGRIPLSFAQHRLWLLDQVDPGSTVFNVPSPMTLAGPLDPAALAAALGEILRRHESLRTVFPDLAGEPWQEVRPPGSVVLPRVDLSGLPPERREGEAERLAWIEGKLPFDLARGPLVRTTLLRLDPERHLLLVTMHHIVTDGWSGDVFLRELLALHAAFAAGRPSPLPELAVQYPDYAAWQRRCLDGPALIALLADWRRRFGSDMPVLQLPTDKPRPPVQTTAGGFRWRKLPVELEERVRALGQRSSATLFMTLLAAFQALLHRYTGQDRIVLGTPAAGRDRAELEGMIGFFVNTLVLPGDLGGDPTFLDLLERARQVTLGAFACQDLPFEKLVEELQPERDRSRSPLFQVMFALQSLPPAEPVAPGSGDLSATPLGIGNGTSQFDLTLYMAETPDGLIAGVEYSTSLFEAVTIERLLEHYHSVLETVTARPETRLSELAVPPLVERPAALAPAEAPRAAEDAATARRDRLAARMSKLSAAQREALEKRLRGGA